MTQISPAGRLKYATKWSIAYVLYWLGILELWKRIALRRRAVVLAYHRVLSDEDAASTWSHSAIVVKRKTFERHMQVLKRGFRVLSLGEFEARLQSRTPFDNASCLITFDDGWQDTYSEAWPLLRRAGLPAVVFLPTRFIGSHEMFWQEQLGFMLFEAWKRAQKDPDWAGRVRTVLTDVGFKDFFDLPRERAVESIIDRVREIKTDAGAKRERLIRGLVDLLGERSARGPTDTDRFMTWDEAREMSRDSVTFGGHSESHRLLTDVSETELQHEVTASKDAIAHELSAKVSAFSYPNGNWNEAAVRAVRDASFSVAFSMDRGTVSSSDHPYSIRRINIHEDMTSCTPMFMARILGIF